MDDYSVLVITSTFLCPEGKGTMHFYFSTLSLSTKQRKHPFSILIYFHTFTSYYHLSTKSVVIQIL